MNLLKIYMSCFEFTDIGIELLISQEIPFLKQVELISIGNYYSVIFGTITNKEGLLIGPLPVAYHHDQLSFIYSNMVKDDTIKDARVVREGNLTPVFLMVFFPVYYDHLFSQYRKNLQILLNNWFKNKRDVKDITKESLDELNADLTERAKKEFERIKNLKQNNSPTALSNNITFLETIGNTLGRIIRLGIFGSTQDVLPTLRNAVKQNFDLLCASNSSTEKDYFSYRFPHLIIEGGKLEASEILNLKKPKLLNVNTWWKGYPDDFDGIFLSIDIPSTNEVIINNIKNILRETTSSCPISLLVRYASDYQGDISTTPIPKVILEARDRTISLIESKHDQKKAEIAIIDVIEKLVPILKS